MFTRALAFVLLLLPLRGSFVPRKAEVGATKTSEERLRSLEQTYAKAAAAYRSRAYLDADQLFQRVRDQSLEWGVPEKAVLALKNMGNCRLFLFRYKEALRTYSEARALAVSAGLDRFTPNIDACMSSVYMELGDHRSAMVTINRALADARLHPPANLRFLLFQAAETFARQSLSAKAIELFRAGMQDAYDSGDLAAAAYGSDHWGGALLMFLGRPAEARGPLTEAFRLRKLLKDPSIDLTAFKLARLERESGNLALASALFENAARDIVQSPSVVVPWYFYLERGRLELALGRDQQAFADFSRSLEFAWRWGLDLAPADSVRAAAGVRVAEVFQAYLQTGLKIYRRSRNPRLARDLFEAGDRLRAFSLRETWNESRPAANREQMAEVLAELRDSEAQALNSRSHSAATRVLELRRRLSYFDAIGGRPAVLGQKSLGNQPAPASVADLQRRLESNQVLFTFNRTSGGVLRCDLTRAGLRIREQRIDRAELHRAIEGLESAILSGAPDRDGRAAELYRILFGGMRPALARKQHWLLALDDALFDVPFPALVTGFVNGRPRYLVEDHSIEIVPGAWVLAAGDKSPARREFWRGGFVGVGDPIYNRADPRYSAAAAPFLANPFSAHAAGIELTRLPSSAAEIDRCARQWGANDAVLLTGVEATGQKLGQSLQRAPAVLHLASHVVFPPDPSLGGYVMLSLGRDGRPDLLGPQQIAMLPGRCALVVLNGCHSGHAEVLPGAGLMGLTRAWLLAGAYVVAATHWSPTDDMGSMFEIFYRRLSRNRDLGPQAAAESLREAQIAMLRRTDWRADPRYWAAYFLVGRR